MSNGSVNTIEAAPPQAQLVQMACGKLLDVMMLIGPGGQERTRREYDDLFAKAGFRLARIVPTSSAVSVVEATIA